MWPVIRSILAVIVGFVAANVTMFAIGAINAVLYPDIVKAVESNDPEALQAAMAATPGAVGAMFVVLVAWVLGSLAGGFLAAWTGRSAPIVHALVVGGLFMLGGIANNLAFPPPVWFWMATVVAFLPAAYAGARLAEKMATQRAGAAA